MPLSEKEGAENYRQTFLKKTKKARKTGAFKEPEGTRVSSEPRESKAQRPDTGVGEPDEEKSFGRAALEGITEGVSMMPQTGDASTMLRAIVGGANAGAGVADAITRARKAKQQTRQMKMKKGMAQDVMGEET